jgi:endoglucanase
MPRSSSTRLLREVCSIPTAPFVEHRVVRYVEEFVAAHRRLSLSRDRVGNLLVTLEPRTRSPMPRWIFAAHMDHPGFVAGRMVDARTLEATFRGWVHVDFVRGTRVRFFTDDQEVPGTVVEADTGPHHDALVPARVVVRVNRAVRAGSPGMFDQGPGRFRGRRFLSRGIDDQGGVASALAMLQELHARPPVVPVGVLLTRAEEEGFIGACAAVATPELLRKSDRIISVECSAVQPYAPQGAGVIVRVGDKVSVFNAPLTYFLTQSCEVLAKRDRSFRYQRALMPGGTCEATVYDAFGYLAAAVCIPLGNYHNMDRAKKTIGPEFINVNDWIGMVKLFVHVARVGHTFDPSNAALRKRVTGRYRTLRRLLTRA